MTQAEASLHDPLTVAQPNPQTEAAALGNIDLDHADIPGTGAQHHTDLDVVDQVKDVLRSATTYEGASLYYDASTMAALTPFSAVS
jgi:hypothetical protein